MSLAQFALGGLPLIPLLAAAVSVLLGHAARRVIALLTAAVVLVFGALVVRELWHGAVVEVALGEFVPPLGIVIRADGLSALFLGMVAVVGSAVTVYAAVLPQATGEQLVTAGDPLRRTVVVWRPSHPGFWPLWLGCWAGLNGVFVAGDLFNTYVALELVSLCAVALVTLGGRTAWPAALRYLFVAVLGALLLLIAIGLLVSVTGTLDIQQASAVIAERPTQHPAVVLALLLLTVGLALKLALVPLHQWLVPAHASAPSAVSPLLSALVIKAALFILLRCWLWIVMPGLSATGERAADGLGAPLSALAVLSWGLALLGAAAMGVGSVMALRQQRLKPLVAYSTVMQVGYWLLLLPILIDPRPGILGQDRAVAEPAVAIAALAGTVALVVGHGIAKAALFLAAGSFKELYGTDQISALRGKGQRHPLLVTTVALSAVGLVGLPISLGFTGKWQLATSAVATGHYWILVVLVVGTLLSAAYLVKVIAPLLAADGDASADDSAPAVHPQLPASAQIAALVLGVLTITTGFLGVWTTGLLEVGAPW